MRRTLAFLAALLAPIGQSATLQAHVIGKDDRVYLSHAGEQRFAAVGKVWCQDPGNAELHYWTTGTLVGDRRTVFTSGHFGIRPKGRNIESHIFPIHHCEYRIYAPHGGKFADGYAYKRFAIAEAIRARPPDDYIEYKADRADWAVITLAGDGVEVSPATPIKIRAASMDQLVAVPEAFLIAYHDRVKTLDRDKRVRSPDCAVRRDRRSSDDTWFVMTCDTNKGSSGGLIFATDVIGDLVAIGYATSDGLARERDRNNYGQPFGPDVLAKIPGGIIPFDPEPRD